MLHDNGKAFTKTYINAKGENDGQAHYYQHQCVGAYDSMFYLDAAGYKTEEKVYISNLIYYHMHPYMSWQQSQKAMNRDRNLIGEKMFSDILKLHDADISAHIPEKVIENDDISHSVVREEGEAVEREQ